LKVYKKKKKGKEKMKKKKTRTKFENENSRLKGAIKKQKKTYKRANDKN